MINSERITEMFLNSLYSQEEVESLGITAEKHPEDSRIIQGLTGSFLVAPRIKEHRAELIEMLRELPDVFRQSVGGGRSFTSMCVDRNGELWTGMHRVMEQFVILSLANELISMTSPIMSRGLPGGVPIITIKDSEF